MSLEGNGELLYEEISYGSSTPYEWYGCAVYIYNGTELVYKDTGNFYRLPSALPKCRTSKSNHDDPVPSCSMLFLNSAGDFASAGKNDSEHMATPGLHTTSKVFSQEACGEKNSAIALKGKLSFGVGRNSGRVWVFYQPYNFLPSDEKYPYAYIVYFGGQSEQEVRNRHDKSLIGNRYAPLRLSWSSYDSDFFTEDKHKQLVHSRWYGYSIFIYNYTDLLAEYTGGVAQTPPNLRECRDISVNTPYKNFFACPEDPSKAIKLASILVAIFVPVGIIIIGIPFCCCYWKKYRHPVLPRMNERSNADESVSAVEMTSISMTSISTVSVIGRNEPPPSYNNATTSSASNL